MKFKDIIGIKYKESLKQLNKSKMWGIFKLNPSNKYFKKNAIKIYTSKKRAENGLKKMNLPKSKYIIKYFFEGE